MALSVIDTDGSAGRLGLSRAARPRESAPEAFALDRSDVHTAPSRTNARAASAQSTRPDFPGQTKDADRSRTSAAVAARPDAKAPARQSAASPRPATTAQEAASRRVASDVRDTRPPAGPRQDATSASASQPPGSNPTAKEPQPDTDPSGRTEAQAAAPSVEEQTSKDAEGSQDADGSDDAAKASETDQAGTPVSVVPLTILQGATPPLPTGPAAGATAGKTTPALAADAGGAGEAQAVAGAALALHVHAGTGPGDVSGPGEGAGVKAGGEKRDGEFAAVLAPVADGAAPPDLQAPATPTARASEAPATASPSAPAPAPVPLGAVPMTIGLRSLAGTNTFEIRLDPKELGRIEVNLAIDKDTGAVQATLVVDRPETLALLQRDAGSLQQALSQAGLDAPDGSISLSLRGDGQSGAGSGRQESGAQGQARRDTLTDTQPIPSAVPLRLYGGRGLDIRI